MADLHPEEDERMLKKRLQRKVEHTKATKREAARIKAQLSQLHDQYNREEEDAKSEFVQAAAKLKRAADEDRSKLRAKRLAANDKEAELVALRARLAELQVRVIWQGLCLCTPSSTQDFGKSASSSFPQLPISYSNISWPLAGPSCHSTGTITYSPWRM